MDKRLSILVILLASPFIALAVHVAFARLFSVLRPGVSNQKVCIQSIIAGNVPVLALVWYLVCAGQGPCLLSLAPTIIYTLIVYNALGYSYFHVFNMSETARRIRILYDLSSGRTMDIDSVVGSYYDTGDILNVRLERLVKMGQLRVEGGRYRLAGRMLLYATKVMVFWGRLIGAPLSSRDLSA